MNQEQHLCSECYEINKGFSLLRNGQKRCVECGGVVLDMQEAADTIAELKSQVRGMEDLL